MAKKAAATMPRWKGPALETIRKETLVILDRYRAAGKKLAKYDCPHCGATLETPCPPRKVGSWSGVKTCYQCGRLALVEENYHGKATVLDPMTA